MVENCIGTLGMPMGVAPTFFINGVHYVVPMAVEEPSVIAAASGAAKLIAASGGFVSQSTPNVMTGQIQILDISDAEEACRLIVAQRQSLIDTANTFCASMQKRGGGVVNLEPRVVEQRNPERRCQKFIVVHIYMDVCESMGANVVNTVAEGLSPSLIALVGGRVGLRILSNLCLERRSKTSFRIPFSQLMWKGTDGAVVANRIVEAYEFAEADPFRASTHNKGIMNGMDAVALATGQDWRAIEAAGHAYACRNGYYGSITSYEIDGDFLVGSLEMPIAVGTKGGALHTHPAYKFTHALLGNPSAQTLAQIILSVGLAQNFAALRALAIEGIQKGHMSLHARNIAVAAGVSSDLVPEVAMYMVVRGSVNVATACEYLEAHKLMSDLYAKAPCAIRESIPSTFHITVCNTSVNGNDLSLNVALPTLANNSPVHVVLKEGHPSHPLQDALLGPKKGVAWLSSVYSSLEQTELILLEPPRWNVKLIKKLKLACVASNLIAYNLMRTFPNQTRKCLNSILQIGKSDPRLVIKAMNDAHYDPVLAVGLPLLYALAQMFDYNVEQFVQKKLLAHSLRAEFRDMVTCLADHPLKGCVADPSLSDDELLAELMSSGHYKRWPATLFLLCDSLSINLSMLTAERIDHLHRLGSYFSFEAMFAHDFAKYDRDQAAGSVCNIYKRFLDIRRLVHSSLTLRRYWDTANVICERERVSIMKMQHSETLLDVERFLETSQKVRAHYGAPPTR